MTINFGTFLLMQSPSARSSQEIYTRGLEIAQAAEALGFGNVWLAEHHFSTYGYLSRPAQLATYIAAKTTRIRVGTAVIVVPLHHPLVIARRSPPSIFCQVDVSTSAWAAATSTTSSSASASSSRAVARDGTSPSTSS